MESEKSKRLRAKKLVDWVPDGLLDDLLWALQQYTAEEMNKA